MTLAASRDPVKRAYWVLLVETRYVRLRGDSFQDFFCSIMEARYPDDFQRVRPWGSLGDRKNDGYLRSTRTLFQVYAPNELRLAETIAKINEDFDGCRPYWDEFLSSWTFVHNSAQGLPPDVLKRLLELAEQSKPALTVGHWGLPEIRSTCLGLDDEQLATLLGPALSYEEVLHVRYEQVEIVVRAIARQSPPLPDEIRPVSGDKIRANALSADVAGLLRLGMTRAKLVGQFFADYYDPLLGDQVAEGFRRKYTELRETVKDPDQTFRELWTFAAGPERGSPTQEAAVLAVLAYLFEQCVIFEEPRLAR